MLPGRLTAFSIRNNISYLFETHFLVPSERFVDWPGRLRAIKPAVGITKNYHIPGTADPCSTGNLPGTLMDALRDIPVTRCSCMIFCAHPDICQENWHDLAVPQENQG
jgi:hypothetical protein